MIEPIPLEGLTGTSVSPCAESITVAGEVLASHSIMQAHFPGHPTVPCFLQLHWVMKLLRAFMQSRDGVLLGSLCVVDMKCTRRITSEERIEIALTKVQASSELWSFTIRVGNEQATRGRIKAVQGPIHDAAPASSARSSFAPCVVIPCYNHVRVLPEIVRYLSALKLPVVIVDDGSSPEARAVLDEIRNAYNSATVIHHHYNHGKGAAVTSGLSWAANERFTHALQIDADGQHDLEDISVLLANAQAHPEAVISGAPIFDDSAPFVRKWGRLLSVGLVWFETGSVAIRDPLCGFRVYPVQTTLSVLSEVRIGERMDFDPDLLVRLVWQGARVRSIPTHVRYPDGNTSNFHYLRDNIRMVRLHLKLLPASVLWRLRLARKRLTRALSLQ